MVRALSAVALFVVIFMVGQTVLDTSFTTIFGPGGVAESPPSPSVLNGLDAFTQLNGGEILFFQNGNFSVGRAGPVSGNALSDQGLANLGGLQVNNRRFAVTGSKGNDITFTPGIGEEVILQVRGTAEGFSVVPTALGTTFLNDTPLAATDGSLRALTDLLLPLTLDRSNPDDVPLTLAPGGSTFNGQTLNGSSMTRNSLTNIGPANSTITPGELPVDVIREPSEPSIVLLVASCLAYMVLGLLRARRLLPGLYGSRAALRARRLLPGPYGSRAVWRVRRLLPGPYGSRVVLRVRCLLPGPYGSRAALGVRRQT